MRKDGFAGLSVDEQESVRPLLPSRSGCSRSLRALLPPALMSALQPVAAERGCILARICTEQLFCPTVGGPASKRNVGLDCSWQYALQHTVVMVYKNSTMYLRPLFLYTCLTGIWNDGHQKQSLPKSYEILLCTPEGGQAIMSELRCDQPPPTGYRGLGSARRGRSLLRT